VKPVFLLLIFSLGGHAFSQSPEKDLARSYSQKGYELLREKNDAASSRFFAKTALEYYETDPLALYIMSKTEPDDWFQALETAQLALDVYQNHIRNPQVLEPHSEYFMFASLEDELVSWIGSLLYRLGRYEDYQGLEESYPKVMLRAENLWQGIVLRQKAEMSVLPILRAALDLYPFDADVALQALPYEVEIKYPGSHQLSWSGTSQLRALSHTLGPERRPSGRIKSSGLSTRNRLGRSPAGQCSGLGQSGCNGSTTLDRGMGFRSSPLQPQTLD
jgi:hypothetical protein